MTIDEIKKKKALYMRDWVAKNPDKVKANKRRTYLKHKAKDNERCKHWRTKNKELKAKLDKIYQETHKEEIALKKRGYYLKNRQRFIKKSSEYTKNKRKTDTLYKLKGILRTRIIVNLISNKYKKSKTTEQLLGDKIATVKEYLESKFKPGMTWENHGTYGWHIDHIVPLSSAKNEQDVIKLFHYTNLQPLWANENLSKGNKIIVA